MDATQQIEDSFLEEEDNSDDEHELEEGKSQREPLALLKVFKNNHIPETEVPLYQGENVLGRDPTVCSVPLQARSISGRHAIISLSVFGPNDRHAHSEATEALLWDLGSLNGTRKGRIKLSPHVRYALTEGDSIVLADLPCQYVSLKNTEKNIHTFTADTEREKAKDSASTSCNSEQGMENGGKKRELPPVPVWTDETECHQSLQMTPKMPERTLVPESDSDSDGEKHGGRERRGIVASDSASSDFSSPRCSTFLTPANKVIPESEDESSITPSPALKGSFLKTANEPEISSDSSKPVPLHFNIDSDTDAEDEGEEMMKATPEIKAAVTAEVDAVNPVDLHMDSDTDVEEEGTEKAKSASVAAPANQDSVNPADLNMDSDTDVEENDPVKIDTACHSGPVAPLQKKKEAASSGLFQLESDTDDDVDVHHVHDSKPPADHAAEFKMDSDTDVDENEETTNVITPHSGYESDSTNMVKQGKSVDSIQVQDAKMLGHHSDSDTDVEDDITKIMSPTVAGVTGNSQTRQTADERSTNAQPDSPVQVQPPTKTVQDEFRMDSDTDVEEGEEKIEDKEQTCADSAGAIIHSSTPRGAGLSEEEIETQVFLSPTQLFKRPVLPSLLCPSVSPGNISGIDDDFAVAETQSFMRDASQADAMLDETPRSLDGPESRRSDGASLFQLDSSHQLAEAKEHNREPAEEDWQLQATQLYAMKKSDGGAEAGQTQLDLDATQAYTDMMGQDEAQDRGKEEEGEETQPLAALGHSNIHTAEKQLIKHGAQNEDNSAHEANEGVAASEPERKEEEDVNDEIQVNSHLSTADTLLIVRSPRQEEDTEPFGFLAAEIRKEQEEMRKEERESRDHELQEINDGERDENETMGRENNEEEERQRKENGSMEIEKKNDVTKDGTEKKEKEIDENKRVKNDNEVDEAGAEADTIAETLAMGEEEEGQEEEQVKESSGNEGTQPAQVESTQPLEPDDHTHVTVPETLPMCEEDEGQEEEENKPRNSRRSVRRRQADHVTRKQPVNAEETSAHVTIAETQPICEDMEGQEEEQQREAMSTKRSSTRRHSAKAKLAKPVESCETLPMCEEEEGQEEKPQSEASSGRKTRQGRQTAKIESTQPLESDSTAEAVRMEEEEQNIKRSLRGKERGRAALGKAKARGRAATEKEKRGKIEQKEDSESEVDYGKKGRVRKNLRQKTKDECKDGLEVVEDENEEHSNKQEEEEESKRHQREKKEDDAREQLKREESSRLDKERDEHEEREKEKQDRLERERLEREKKEREEKKQFESEMKEREEKERFRREKQLEKEMREQEEKDRLERENREKEENERLEEEMRAKHELEQKRENERKKQEENDKLAREKVDRVERLEKEMGDEEKQGKERAQKENVSKDNNDGKEKSQTLGKRKTGLGRKGSKRKKEEKALEGSKEGLQTEQELSEIQKQKCEEGSSRKHVDELAESDAKPRQGRRFTRKSVVPPDDVEDEGGPAKRTRSRSNSSNSVCSEQSTQNSLDEGRRRGGRRKTAEEVKERGRPSGRRRTTTTSPSTEKEDTKQADHSRSNSRSSDRSSSSVATQSQGRGRKGRRSVKAEERQEEEEEGEQSAAVGRGRGRGRGRERGGKPPGAEVIKVEEDQAKVMAVATDSVSSQGSTRGRKRGAYVSMLITETPQPTPKTPRRSLAGQTPKVLFTGVMDEDGEKVVVRLGGGLAKGVGDMTHLVTDKVRRTVKFLCAVARGVPIVTPDWLSKCGKAGTFLSPNGFLVKDVEQEKKFNFTLQEALRVASSQPLLQGYEIHVTPSVKPEPAHMKEIITCCGARFLPKMPSAHKAQKVVVVSCEEDRAQCERAWTLSFPVVSAEFLLTGILQQKLDMQTHALCLSPAPAVSKPAARSRGK